MTQPARRGGRGRLLRDVAVFQLKLLLSAGRDLVLVPLSLAAAAFDFVFNRSSPGLFRATLLLGRWSDEWIGVFPRHDDTQGASFDADALLGQIEGLIRDPKSGADKARLLSRWARMQIARKDAPEK